MKLRNFLQILAVSLALSTYSAWSLAGRQRSPSETSPDDSVAGIRLVRRAEAETLWHDPSTLFVDVRSATDFEFGRIAGAVHLPDDDFENRFSELQPRLERASTVVVYCGSRDCGLSLWAAIRLRNAGFKQTVIFPGGWNEWVLGGLPTAGTGR